MIKFIIDKFTEQKVHFEELNGRYDDKHQYPDHVLVQKAITLMDDVLSQQKDNIALIDRVIKNEDELYESKYALQNVESFFKTQVGLFDAAVKFEEDLRNDFDYISKDKEAETALNRICLITTIQPSAKYNYKRIPELNDLMLAVKAAHDKLLEDKRTELLEIVRQCMAEVHQTANENAKVRDIVIKADEFFAQRKEKIAETKSLALLDGLVPPMWTYKDDACESIEIMLKPTPPKQLDKVKDNGTPYTSPKKVIKSIHRQAIFPAKKLESEEEIDAYVEKMRRNLRQLLKNCDGIQLN